MSTDRDLTQTVRSWLKEDRHEVADRVLDSVLDQLDATNQRRAGWLARRFETMNPTLRYSVAAAIVVVAVLAAALFARPNVGDDDEATPSASPSAAPSGITPLSGQGELAAGTYLIDDPFPIRATLTVPDEWEALTVDHAIAMLCVSGEGCDAGARPGVGFWIVDRVAPSCPVTGETATPAPQPSLGPTVDDLATALAGRPEYRVESGPTPITFSGYEGVELDLVTALGGLSCADGLAPGWVAGRWMRETLSGEHSQLLILNVEGVRVLIDGMFTSDNTDADIAEMQAVLDSIQIEGLSGSE
jgi:hypothetical protein